MKNLPNVYWHALYHWRRIKNPRDPFEWTSYYGRAVVTLRHPRRRWFYSVRQGARLIHALDVLVAIDGDEGPMDVAFAACSRRVSSPHLIAEPADAPEGLLLCPRCAASSRADELFEGGTVTHTANEFAVRLKVVK